MNASEFQNKMTLVKAQLKAKSAKATLQRQKAESKTEKEKERVEQERQKLISKPIASLTKNLPEASFSPNQKDYIYKRQIAEKAFQSAVEAGHTFSNYTDNQLYIEADNQIVKVLATDLKAACASLYKWSGIPMRYLQDSKGKPADHFSLYHSLVTLACFHKTKQDRCKSSDEHLSDLVAACAKSQTKITGTRDVAMAALVDDTVRVAKRLRLSFAYNLSGHLFLNCSDAEFNMVKLSTKQTLPIFAEIIQGSSVAGKFPSIHDAQRLLDGFTRSQNRV